MSPEQFANEFVADFLEDRAKGNGKAYYFTKNIISDDPDLKLIKQELAKVGFTLVPIEDDLWKPVEISQEGGK